MEICKAVLAKDGTLCRYKSKLDGYCMIHHLKVNYIPVIHAIHAIHATECPICYESIEGHRWIDVGCGHVFHMECIATWLGQKESCPMCRSNVPASICKKLGIDKEVTIMTPIPTHQQVPTDWSDFVLAWDNSSDEMPLEGLIARIAMDGFMQDVDVRRHILMMLVERR